MNRRNRCHWKNCNSAAAYFKVNGYPIPSPLCAFHHLHLDDEETHMMHFLARCRKLQQINKVPFKGHLSMVPIVQRAQNRCRNDYAPTLKLSQLEVPS